MQPNVRNTILEIKSERVVEQMQDSLATLTRPLCYDCNSTDVFCSECGFDFEECTCDAVEREIHGSNGYICKVCMGVAIDETDYLSNVQAKCPACGDTLDAGNIATWPKFPANSLCDDCYVSTSIGSSVKSSGEIIVVQDDGPCACGRYHICDNCGIYRVSTKDKWQVIENIDLEFKASCNCNPEKKFSCDTCGVFRKNPADPWIKTQEKQYVSKGTTTTTTPATTKSWSSGSTSNYGTYGKCRHYGEPLKFPDGVTVYASSSNSKRDSKDMPDFGLYLDWVWKPSWRAEFIDWQDYGTPTNFSDAYDAIVEAYDRAKAGKKVEVGCIGGHGRTGTVLACMGVISGQTPEDAIKYVRKEYCDETIETGGQEWFVRWFNAQWNELPFTEEEPDSWYGMDYGYGYGGYSTTKSSGTVSKAPATPGSHSQSHHFNMWVAGAKGCDAVCKWGKKDFEEFAEGKGILQNTLDRCDVPMNAWTAEAYNIVMKLNQEKPMSFKLNVVEKLDPVMIKVRGYRVPKPLPTEKQHNPTLANCSCDVCRYIALGGTQLFDTPSATSLVHDLDSNAKVIKMYVSGGEIIDVPIADSFEPKPPAATSKAKVGTRKGEYIMTEDHGWVWDQLGLAD